MRLPFPVKGALKGKGPSAESQDFRDIQINIFQEGYRTKAQRPTIYVVMCFLLVAALAGLYSIYQVYDETGGNTSELETELARVKADVQKAKSASNSLETRLEKARSELKTLTAARDTIRGKDWGIVDTFDLLTETIPNSPSIANIQIKSTEISITGQATNADSLIDYARQLEATPQVAVASILSLEPESEAGQVKTGSLVSHQTIAVRESAAADEGEGEGQDGEDGENPVLLTPVETEEGEEGEGEGSASGTVTVGVPLVASFELQYMTPPEQEPVLVKFTDTSESDDTIVSWEWDFGDGTTSTQQHPYHEYTEEGEYTVVLTVTDSKGRTGRSTSAMFKKPNADFTAQLVTCEDPLTIRFTDQSTSFGKLLKWEWDFDGDEEVDSTKQNPTYTYPQPGEYVVSLTVEGTLRTPATAQATIRASTPPTADFSVTPTDGTGALNVKFVDESTSGDKITQWQWDFGEGRTSNEQNPTHSYTRSGPFTVSLRVVENDGNCDTKVKTIEAGSDLSASFVASPSSGGPLTVQFEDASPVSKPAGINYYWDFGDGKTAEGASVSHSYAEEGTYTVTLRVTKTTSEDDASEVNTQVASTSAEITVSKSTAAPFSMVVQKAKQ